MWLKPQDYNWTCHISSVSLPRFRRQLVQLSMCIRIAQPINTMVESCESYSIPVDVNQDLLRTLVKLSYRYYICKQKHKTCNFKNSSKFSSLNLYPQILNHDSADWILNRKTNGSQIQETDFAPKKFGPKFSRLNLEATLLTRKMYLDVGKQHWIPTRFAVVAHTIQPAHQLTSSRKTSNECPLALKPAPCYQHTSSWQPSHL